MKKKTILFVMHEFSIGGAVRVVSHLANNLDRDKFVVHLCLFKKKGVILEELSNDVIIHDLKAGRVLTGAYKLLFLLLDIKPDVVFTSITHVNLLVSFFIPLTRRQLPNTIFITREVNIPSIRAKYLPKSRQMDFFYKKFIKNYDYIIAQSQFMKDDILDSYHIPENKIKIINNPIDIHAIERKIDDVRQDKGQLFRSGTIAILAVGVLRRQKGFDRLLRVVPLLGRDYHLYILGEGPERQVLEEIIEELKIEDRVTLLGHSNNPYIYMKKADFVVLSSRYEGFPNVILEANACGKFVVAFACPGVSEEIIQNNLNGLLVECGNIEKLADAIKRFPIIAKDEKKIRDTTDRYRVENVVKEYENIFLSNAKKDADDVS